MASAGTAQRASIKAAAGYDRYQQKRRDAALEQQRTARGSKLQLARMLAAERLDATTAGVDAAMAGPPGNSQTSAHASAGTRDQPEPGWDGDAAGLTGAELRRHYARQLMLPEWLTDVPSDLGTDWLVIPRPEGRRCLVVAAHGTTTVRTRTGSLLGRFSSRLPGGSRHTAGGGEFTVVDAVLTEGSAVEGHGAAAAPCGPIHGAIGDAAMEPAEAAVGNTDSNGGMPGDSIGTTAGSSGLLPGSVLWVSDVIAWRGVDLAGCGAECRAFWLSGHMAECHQPIDSVAVGTQHGPELRLLPALPASPEGLADACSGSASGAALGFVQDGAWLLHKEGHYTPGSTPLVMLWKDASCSRYLLDTEADGSVPPQQQLILTYRGDATVATADEPPVVLGRMPPEWVIRMGPKLLRPGRLLRFALCEGGLRFEGGRPAGADLKYEGPANQRRGRADVYSKILFQAMARAGRAPALEQLQAVAAASLAAAGASSSAAGDAGAMALDPGGAPVAFV